MFPLSETCAGISSSSAPFSPTPAAVGRDTDASAGSWRDETGVRAGGTCPAFPARSVRLSLHGMLPIGGKKRLKWWKIAVCFFGRRRRRRCYCCRGRGRCSYRGRKHAGAIYCVAGEDVGIDRPGNQNRRRSGCYVDSETYWTERTRELSKSDNCCCSLSVRSFQARGFNSHRREIGRDGPRIESCDRSPSNTDSYLRIIATA